MNFPRIRRIRLALGLLAGISMHGPVCAAAPTKEEVAETAKWFDGLEWPNLKGKPYVEIVLGKERLRDDKPEAKGRTDQFIDGPALRGFLLAADDKGFTVFDERIVRQGRREMRPGWVAVVDWIPQVDPKWARPEYEVVSRVIELPAAVEDAIAAARLAPGKDGPPAISPSKMSRGVAIFALARWCARAGRADLTERLDAELVRARNWRRSLRASPAISPEAPIMRKPRAWRSFITRWPPRTKPTGRPSTMRSWRR